VIFAKRNAERIVHNGSREGEVTEAQERSLGVKVRLLRALVRQLEQRGEPVPFEFIGKRKTSGDWSAMKSLVEDGFVLVAKIPNRRNSGSRRGYIITALGISQLVPMWNQYNHAFKTRR